MENEMEMEMENNLVSEGQNLVEAHEEVEDIENPNYAVGNVNTNNFGTVERKINATLSN